MLKISDVQNPLNESCFEVGIEITKGFYGLEDRVEEQVLDYFTSDEFQDEVKNEIKKWRRSHMSMHCRFCGKDFTANEAGWQCSGPCDYTIPYEWCGKEITVEDANTLAMGRIVYRKIGFVNKSGRKFNAALALDEKGKIYPIYAPDYKNPETRSKLIDYISELEPENEGIAYSEEPFEVMPKREPLF